MIKLFSFGANLGVTDPSPFVLKVATYMKMAGIQYESVPDVNNLRKAPKGKLPYIEDDGGIVADSFFILKHLQKKYGISLDNELSGEQKAIAGLIIKSLDENFYWCIVHSRWMRDDTWPTVKEAFFGNLPFPLGLIVPSIVRRGVKSALMKHGIGKHTDAEILEIAQDTLENLSTLLGDKKYFFGEKPSTLDAAAYSFLAQLTISNLDTPLHRMAKGFDNLVSYCRRITDNYFPDTAVS